MANIIPSASNTVGTAGGLLAALAVGLLAKAGYIAILAAAIGMPEATVTTMAVTGIGLLANYAVTHWAEAKNLNDLLASYWPVVQRSFPNDPTATATPNNLNKS